MVLTNDMMPPMTRWPVPHYYHHKESWWRRHMYGQANIITKPVAQISVFDQVMWLLCTTSSISKQSAKLFDVVEASIDQITYTQETRGEWHYALHLHGIGKVTVDANAKIWVREKVPDES